jgi:uncharacterized LabA/DUF88 family protein
MSYSFNTQEIAESGYLFIDGGCLRSMLRDVSDRYFHGNLIDFDYAKFAKYFSKVFYYDALPGQQKDEPKDEYEMRIETDKDFFDMLGATDKYHVYLGSMHRRKKRNEQKQVDIMIAVDMLTHAFRKNTSQVTLFTTDSDFIPLIDKMVDNGMHINLWYPDTKNCNANKELIASADRKKRIGFEDVYASCTDAFKQKFKLPEAGLMLNDNCEIEIHEWQDLKRGTIKLGRTADKYMLRFKSGENHAGIEYSDLKVLKNYVEDKFALIIPETPNLATK